MNRKYRLITISLFISFSLFVSCTHFSVPKYIQQHYTIKYPGGANGLDTLININGYYSYQIIKPNHSFIKGKLFSSDYIVVYDTFYSNYIFFKDGLFLNNMYIGHCAKPECMEESIERLNNDSSNKSNELLHGFWGSYKLSGDTIITQYIFPRMAIDDFCAAWQVEFKIIDRNTIIEIACKPIYHRTVEEIQAFEDDYNSRIKQTAKFIPLKTLPKTNCWLKNEKWFMQNDTIKNSL